MMQARFLCIVCLLISCCASNSTKPSLALFPLGDPVLDWFADGPETLFVVTNPTDQRLSITYVCEGERASLVHQVVVAPHSAWRALGRLMNKERFGQPCEISSWEVAP